MARESECEDPRVLAAFADSLAEQLLQDACQGRATPSAELRSTAKADLLTRPLDELLGMCGSVEYWRDHHDKEENEAPEIKDLRKSLYPEPVLVSTTKAA